MKKDLKVTIGKDEVSSSMIIKYGIEKTNLFVKKRLEDIDKNRNYIKNVSNWMKYYKIDGPLG